MLVDHLQVEAFRGIRHPVAVDFTAPLTLLYAPNGTGKTTLCDALEWLLTGRVERLSGGVEEVRCRLAPQQPAVVRATLRVGHESFEVRRTHTGDGTLLERRGIGADEFGVMDPALLLELVTRPGGTAGGAPHGGGEIRSTWLRATRLLSGPTLDLLLDTAGESRGGQSLALSELFGVTGLQRQEMDLERILEALGASVIGAELETLDGQGGASGDAGGTAPGDLPAYLQVQARAHLAHAARALGSAHDAADPEAALQTLLAVQAAERDRLARRSAALRRVQANWPQHTLRVERAPLLAAELSAMEESGAALREERDGFAAELAHTRREANALAVDLAELARWRSDLDDELVTLHRTLRDLRKYRLDPARAPRPARLPEAVRVLEREEEHGLALELCLQHVPEWRRVASRLAELRAELELQTEQLHAMGDEEDLSARMAANADTLALLRARKLDLLNPLDHIRAAARALLDNLPGGAACPVCGHDHASAEALREAMAAALKGFPAFTSELDRQIQSVAEEASRLQEQQRRWIVLRERQGEVTQAMQYPAAVLDRARGQLEGVGLRAADPEAPGLKDQLARRLRAQKITIRGARADVDLARVEHLSAQRLDEARGRLARLLASPAGKPRDAAGTPGEAALPADPGAWPDHLRQLRDGAAARLQAAHLQLGEVTAADLRLLMQHEAASAQLDAVETEQGAAAERLHAIREQIHDFEECWRLLDSGLPPGEEALRQAADEIAEHREAVTGAAAHLDQADSLLRAAHAAATTGEVQRLRREQQAGRRRLEILRQYSDSITDAIRILREHKRHYVESQLRILREAIGALFLRAQANRFIDRIDVRMTGGDALGWLAGAGDFVLDRMAELSQGQRQNLALAIFFARARGLGGSFFLDEPLAHLDDVNRVAILDVLRVLLAERAGPPLRLIVTTSDFALVRHLGEKLSRMELGEPAVVLRTYQLSGNPRSGVRAQVETLSSVDEPAPALAAGASLAGYGADA
jgi:exonuclease SbcC